MLQRAIYAFLYIGKHKFEDSLFFVVALYFRINLHCEVGSTYVPIFGRMWPFV
jgi:hypothetical protein